MRAAHIFIFFVALCVVCLPREAQAAGFLLPPKERQIFIKSAAPSENETSREIFFKIGISEKWMGSAKYLQTSSFVDGRHENVEYVKGVMTRNAPILAIGLLPPYMLRGLRYMLPMMKIERRKAAELGAIVGWRDMRLNLPDRRDRTEFYGYELTLLDRLDIGRFNLFQQAVLAQRKYGDSRWHNFGYKFEMGWQGEYWIGNEVLRFRERGNWQDTKYWQYIRWQPRGKKWYVSLAQGTLRDPDRTTQRTQVELSFSF